MYYISSKQGTKYGITDTNDRVEEFYTKAKVIQISKSVGIIGVNKYKETIRVSKINIYDFDSLVRNYLVPMLRKADIDLGYDSEYNTRNRKPTWEVRFIGGMGNWSCSDGSEDTCDADRIEPSVAKKIRRVCEEFTKQYGVEVHWYCDSEKGWSSFIFE